MVAVALPDALLGARRLSEVFFCLIQVNDVGTATGWLPTVLRDGFLLQLNIDNDSKANANDDGGEQVVESSSAASRDLSNAKVLPQDQ